MPLAAARTQAATQVRQAPTKAKKNMLPKTLLGGGANGEYDSTITPTTNFSSINEYVDVQPNTNYVLSCIHNGRISVYDESATTPIVAYTAAQSVGFNSGSRTKVRVFLGNGNLGAGTFTFKNWQLEPGTVATPFEPYQAVPDLRSAVRVLQAVR